MNKNIAAVVALVLGILAVVAGVVVYRNHGVTPIATPGGGGQFVLPGGLEVSQAGFGESVKYEAPTAKINTAIAKDFNLDTIQNLHDMEKAYGFTFSADELTMLSDRKFVVKNLLDTSIRPNSGGDNVREFTQLYEQVKGPQDYHGRGPQNAEFFTSDVFFNSYNNLFTELMKEMENKTFAPAMMSLSSKMFDAANAKFAAATTDADKQKWRKVRNYFAVPYAIFTTSATPLSQDNYYSADGSMADPEKVQADFKTRDATVDTIGEVTKFVKDLNLDAESEKAVLADLKNVYDASDNSAPTIFADEYAAYAKQEGVDFAVDWTQFTPRGAYTSSSLRRQYFRGMKWYIMVAFFLKSPDLTTYSYGVAQLLAENPQTLKDYDRLEAAINFLVGTSDDLMPVDYLKALAAGKGAADPSAAAMDYLAKAHNPKIKDMAATYETVGEKQSAEVLLSSKSMRFFSGKFIIDSYWTGYLTQGDEAPRPGYTQKLPPMASSLEVMTLLGSKYAETQIPKLDFYSEKNKLAIAQALGDLKKENATLTDVDWQKNLYTGWLWTIKSLFGWQEAHKAELPRFMQTATWEVKTLQTASAWWTELRHATILYAKQSFAELGGGGAGCDERLVPPPPKSYIEPQLEAYARLSYLAKRTSQGLKDQGFRLNNFAPLDNFITLMDVVQEYTAKELGNTTLAEQVTTTTGPDPDHPEKTCTQHMIEGQSDWERLRVGVVGGLQSSLPIPTEGPILDAKDRRAALIADVHTGGDSANPRSILYEAEGVPYVIFTAVSDANGPRLTVGFTYSHYEFTKLYGGNRLTDDDWQKTFYTGSAAYSAYDYTSKSTWPKPNAWYAPLFETTK